MQIQPRFWKFLLVMVLIMLAVVTVTVFAAKVDAQQQKQTKVVCEQVKVFGQDSGGQQRWEKLESDVNTWLKANGEKIEVLGVTQSSTVAVTLITIRYKMK